MHSCKCMCMGIRVCVRMHVWAFSVYLYLFVCSVGCYSISDPFGEIRTVAGDPDLIRIRAHCGPDTQAIRRPIFGMIRRSVPIRVVKTRR